MSKNSTTCKVQPGKGGFLEITSPDINTRYDMGNKHTLCTVYGDGRVGKFFLTDGYDAGTGSIQIVVDGEVIRFSSAKAIGRLWQLAGRSVGKNLEILVSCYLAENKDALFQDILVKNESEIDANIKIHLTVFPSRRSAGEIFHDRLGRVLSRFKFAISWWARKGSKRIIPHAATSLRLSEHSYIETCGGRSFIWGSEEKPVRIGKTSREGFLDYQFVVPSRKQRTMTWAVSAGDNAGLVKSLRSADRAYEDVIEYSKWLNSHYSGPENDDFLRTLYCSGLNVSLAMYKEFPDNFSGLLAGTDYAYPPRLYFRDGYWTAQVLLGTSPWIIRNHLLSLARGIHPNGSCPSAVFSPHILRENPGITSLDWLPDHHDSPSFFILLVSDYLKVTDDWTILDEKIPLREDNQRPYEIRELLHLTAGFLISLDRDGDGLIEKPYKANDWADNVKRNVWVTYDQALYTAALYAMDRISSRLGDIGKIRYKETAEKAQDAMNQVLWDEEKGYFVNYKRPGFQEDNLSADSLVVLRYNLTTPERKKRFLEAAAKLLQTRYNKEQICGDWGIMCAYPFYKHRKDLFDKSAQDYHYHNGADWPYWDGVYAEVLKREEDRDWEYAVRRWWEYSLEQGWLTPPEYFSPAYPPGGMLQGWSSMPAVILGP